MRLFFLTFVLSFSAGATDLSSARIVNLITDDEGTKVIAQVNNKKPVILYISQNHGSYANLTAVLLKAKTEQQNVNIKATDAEVKLITKVELK